MFKVLIVDDEAPAREAVKFLGNWDKLGIGEILEARNGLEGLALLEEIRPEIIIVDMKMPVMDGAQFLKNAKNAHPYGKYIVISGYDDFEYAKNAIRSGVQDYLLKPLVQSELNEVLSQSVKELEAERARKERMLADQICFEISLPLAKEKVVEMFLEDSINGVIRKDYAKIVQLTAVKSGFGIALVSILNFKEVCRSQFENDENKLSLAVTNALNEFVLPDIRSFCFRNSTVGNGFVLFLEMDSLDGDPEDIACSYLKAAVGKLENIFGLNAISAIGGTDTNLDSLPNMFRNARSILESANLLDRGKAVFLSSGGRTASGMVSVIDKRQQLLQALESGNLYRGKQIVKECFLRIKESGYFSIDYARRIITEFSMVFEDISRQADASCNDLVVPQFRSGLLQENLADIDMLCEYFSKTLERIFNSSRKECKLARQKSIDAIKDYIDRYYFKEINLDMFYRDFYFSKDYLSKLFKARFGCGIYEYALKVRMDKAKEMLQNPELKIQIISDMLGYKDHNYFSKAFKKYYGISPTEYRELFCSGAVLRS